MAIEPTPAFEGELHLDHLKVLEIKGENAEKFLQGQTSAQVSLANGSFAPLTCFCTPKGRIIANGQLYRVSEHHYRLLVSAPLAEKLAAHLTKFAVFFRAELRVDTSIALIGAGPTVARARATTLGLELPARSYLQTGDENASILRLPGEERYVFCLREEPTQPDATLQNGWRLADIRSGLAWLDDRQEDHFLPQMINWEALGGISFKKGCYTGQEVVARAHFRGQVKKRLVRASLETDTLPMPTEALTDDTGKRLGELVSSAFADEGRVELLAVVTTKAIEESRALYYNSAPVILESLPYPVERLDPEQLAASLAS